MFERIKALFSQNKDVKTSRRWRLKKSKFAGPIVKDKAIDYLLNDRSTPGLAQQIMPPEPYGLLQYSVHS